MKRLISYGVLCALLTTCRQVFASDMPDRQAPAAPTPPAFIPAEASAPAFSWTGAFVGAEAGYGSANYDMTNGYNPNLPTAVNPLPTNSLTGALAGVRAGYNYQTGSFVVGVLGNVDYSNMSLQQSFVNNTNTATLTSNSNISGLGSAQLLLGFAVDRFMLFATGGYAGASYNITNTAIPNSSTNPSTTGTDSRYLNGAAFSLGAQYAVTSNVSLSLSFQKDLLGTSLNNAFSSISTPAASTTTPSTTTTSTTGIGASFSEVKAGVDVHF